MALPPCMPDADWPNYLPLKELLRSQKLVGKDLVSRGAAARGLVAWGPWHRGQGRGESHTGTWAACSPRDRTQLSPRPHGVETSLTCRGINLFIEWL